MGYEIAIPEPIPDFNYRRNPLPHDFRILGLARRWLGRDDILYCAHNVLFWLPLLRRFGGLRCRIVSLLYARETLDSAAGHDGIIGLNPAATEQARKLAPSALVAHLGWGADLSAFPALPYHPDFLLSCGVTFRDNRTLSRAAAIAGIPVRLIVPTHPDGKWPSNVEIIESRRGLSTSIKPISFYSLLNDHYSRASASLIITGHDPKQEGACGFTNLIEAMAMARPVILTRTGSLVTEIDVEKEGCGLFVPYGDAEALAHAMRVITDDPSRAAGMGRRGRAIAEERYSIGRFARRLDDFFRQI